MNYKTKNRKNYEGLTYGRRIDIYRSEEKKCILEISGVEQLNEDFKIKVLDILNTLKISRLEEIIIENKKLYLTFHRRSNIVVISKDKLRKLHYILE